MSTFHLKVITPEKQLVDELVSRLIVRTIDGDVGILKGHINYVTPLDVGIMRVQYENGTEKCASISRGMLRMENDTATVLTESCEWDTDIDVERAKLAEKRARAYIDKPTEYHSEDVAQLKLRRALNRISIASKK